MKNIDYRAGKINHEAQLRLEALIKRGDEAMNAGRFVEAEREYREALQVQPQYPSADALLKLADAYERAGDLRRSLATWHTLLGPHPHWSSSIDQDPMVRIEYLLVLAKAGDWRDAANVYDQVMRREVTLSGHGYRGVPMTAAGLDHNALAAAAHLLLAQHSPMHEFQTNAQMLQHAEAAVRLEPNWAEAHYRRAELLMENRKRYAEALAEFDKAAALGDEAMKAMVRKRSVYLRAEMHRRAIDPAYRAKQEKLAAESKPPE